MKFTVNTARFREAVGSAMKAVSNGKLKPILAGVLLDATGDDLTVTGTDLSLTIRKTLGANITVSGSVVVPARILFDYLREMTTDTVDVSYDGNSVRLKSKGDKCDLRAYDAMEFPQPPPFDADQPHRVVDGRKFKAAVDRVKHAADKKVVMPRFDLQCIRLELTASAVKIIATDAKRIAYTECPCESVGEPAEMIDRKGVSVPIRLVDVLGAFADTDQIALAVTGSQVRLVAGGTLVTMTMAEGLFPPYLQLVPRKQTVTIPLVAGEFEAKVRMVKRATDDESCRVDFRFEPGKCYLTARSEDNGRCDAELDIEYDGPEFNVAMDPDYVTGFLKAAMADGAHDVRMEGTSHDKPVVFKPLDGSESWDLVMPMG